jgi:predicted anti-sigma-YlaC factor YlaD
MTCAEFEILLADYIDDTLGSSERTALEQHAATCAGCREFFEDAKSAAALMHRVEEVFVPPDLVTRIAFQAPRGRTREPLERQGLLAG